MGKGRQACQVRRGLLQDAQRYADRLHFLEQYDAFCLVNELIEVAVKAKFYYVFRSAVHGRYVSAAYAKRYPANTVRERRQRG